MVTLSREIWKILSLSFLEKEIDYIGFLGVEGVSQPNTIQLWAPLRP